MERNAHISLLGVVCRLKENDGNGEEAATQWEQIFGVPRSRDLLQFTNARVGFIHGEPGKREGIVSIGIGCSDVQVRDAIFRRAKDRGVLITDGDGPWVSLFGIRWHFSLTGNGTRSQAKL